MALYILLTSVIIATLQEWKWIKTSSSVEWTVGSINSWSLSEALDVDLADALNMARTLVVELDFLIMTWTGG